MKQFLGLTVMSIGLEGQVLALQTQMKQIRQDVDTTGKEQKEADSELRQEFARQITSVNDALTTSVVSLAAIHTTLEHNKERMNSQADDITKCIDESVNTRIALSGITTKMAIIIGIITVVSSVLGPWLLSVVK